MCYVGLNICGSLDCVIGCTLKLGADFFWGNMFYWGLDGVYFYIDNIVLFFVYFICYMIYCLFMSLEWI